MRPKSNHLLPSALLILLPVIAYPQSPTGVSTTDRHSGSPKPDEALEDKKAIPRPSPSSSTNSSKIDLGANSLPPNFTGHNIDLLFSQLRTLKKRLEKSEFETTAEFESRAARERQKPILGNLTVKDRFIIVIPKVEANYDTDSQTMRFFLPVEANRSAVMSRGVGPNRAKKTTQDLSDRYLYHIQWRDISYGVKGIFFDEMGGLTLTKTNKNWEEGFLAEVKVSVEEAKQLKDVVKAAVVVQLAEPYVGFEGGRLQVRVIDVYFFDQRTGKVLAKMRRGGR